MSVASLAQVLKSRMDALDQLELLAEQGRWGRGGADGRHDLTIAHDACDVVAKAQGIVAARPLRTTAEMTDLRVQQMVSDRRAKRLIAQVDGSGFTSIQPYGPRGMQAPMVGRKRTPDPRGRNGNGISGVGITSVERDN